MQILKPGLLKSLLLASIILSACGEATTPPDQPEPTLPTPSSQAERFATLALDCVHREYPNKISHVMQSDADAQVPRNLTPAFYGCFDWHSSVHGHWLLVRTLKTQNESALDPAIRAALNQSFTVENITGELAYYKSRPAFERPYGVAWFLQLITELEESDDPQLRTWRETLRPLEDQIVSRMTDWLPKLSYPVRLGTHNQTAFAFGLMLDYARTVENTAFETLLADKIKGFHLGDINCPIAYEPSGEDFLSPCLMEADLMRRVLSREAYSSWLARFLPNIPIDGSDDWLAPGIVLDASDGKLVHLDGVNLSRAWALEGMAAALAADDPRRASLQAAADVHATAGLAAVSDEHYSGSHWLASFATYLTTQRGVTGAGAPQ